MNIEEIKDTICIRIKCRKRRCCHRICPKVRKAMRWTVNSNTKREVKWN